MAAGDLIALLDLTTLGDVDAHLLVDAGSQVVAVLAAKADDVDDAAISAVRHLKGGVADVVGLGTEDGAQQALLGSQSALALRRDLADRDVAGPTSAPMRMMPSSSRLASMSSEVQDLAGDLLRTELGVAGVDLVTGDVDGRQQVLGHRALGHDDTVLVVKAFPRHVGHGEVLAQCELAVIGRRTVGQRLALLNGVTDAHERTVVDAGGLVGALVLGGDTRPCRRHA